MDISMCQAVCPVSKHCRRHPDSGSIPDPIRQSWLMVEPDGKDGCDCFWAIGQQTILDDKA